MAGRARSRARRCARYPDARAVHARLRRRRERRRRAHRGRRPAASGQDGVVVDAKAGETDLGEPDVVVDALFGTGFTGEPRAEAAALIERMNALGAPVLAVDLPSGVDASTGEIAGAAVARRR